MKQTRKPLALRKETVRNLASTELVHAAGGLAPMAPIDGTRGSVYQCGTLISCAACTDLRCIINTSVATSC